MEANSADGIPLFLSWFPVDQLVILTVSGSTLLSHGVVFIIKCYVYAIVIGYSQMVCYHWLHTRGPTSSTQ